MKTFILFISLFLLCATAYTQTLPTGFNSINAVPGVTWQQPVGVVFSKSGNQLFVWEKAGRVYVCTRNGDGDYIRQDDPVLDIAEEVGNYHDYGLLGFALDPQFESNGLIYLSYVVDRHHLLYFGTSNYNSATSLDNDATIGRITRYKTSSSAGILSAISASRFILLGETKETGVPIMYLSHGMGSLAFAADGTLLASTGDGASFTGADVGPGSDSYYVQALADGIIGPDENVGAWRSQMLTSLNGKLLRIDAATGAGISSNPFFEEADSSTKSKIWALG
ncbi:MAG TPA: PQQ-dependent sugar dehydrogenase, partial [Chitinophagaceae bacterium]|nr:PQQ-dependent sugar dehydrogenase [Chitinophagaceae bacterium]